MSKREAVYELVSLIPAARIATYGQLALLSGIKNPRVVGLILHENPNPEKIPCHRVVNRKGLVAESFAFGGGIEQRERLKNEGITFADGRVDLSKHLWNQRVPLTISIG
ncbi:MGMT family protein [Patescibacteria group bacterium]|nr:MGMT family protein [Patescibacteria group bacterium]